MCVWHRMRDLLIGLGLPLVVLAAALLPVALAEDHTPPGYEEHARRLKTQASLVSDVRPGRARVQELRPLGGEESPDAVEGTVRWVGPFGVTVLEVEIEGRSGRSSPRPLPAALAWLGLGLGVVVPPAFVVWRNTRT